MVRDSTIAMKTLADAGHRSVDLRLPDKLIKDSYETLVWGDELPDGTRGVFKLYRHRNIFRWWSGKCARCRAEREYDRLLILHQAGVNCAEPLFFGRGRDRLHGRYDIICTREIPHAGQLKAYLMDQKKRNGNPDLSRLMKTLRSLHAAGVYHGSLTPNNIVVSQPPGEDPSFYVVDLPRGTDFPYDLGPTKMGWYDIVHFIHRTSAEAGEEACLAILDVYGFSDRKKAQLMQFLRAYKPSKWLRYRLRNEFGLNAWFSRKLHQREGTPYPKA